MSRKSILLAAALGFAAIGSSFVPATAMPLLHPGDIRQIPHPASPAGALTSIQPGSHILLPQVATKPGTVAALKPGNLKEPLPVGQSGGVLKPGNLKEPLPGGQAGGILKPGNLKEPLPGSQAGGTLKPGNLKEPLPSGQIGPVGQVGGPYGNGGIDNVCPLNKFKCPPAGQPGPVGSSQPGNPTPGPQGSGPSFPMPTGQIYPSGGPGPVVVLAQPVAVQAPAPVAVGTATTGIVTSATRPAQAAAEPCNCLTKQYLTDGSVLFRDICTKEAALATPAAQVQGAAPAAQ
jgi:hypothetical protein